MSKVLVDPAALEEAAKWLEVHSSSSGSAEAFAAEALREAIAQPAEAEGVVIAAKCVNRKCLRHNAMLSDYGLTLPHGEALVRQSDHLAALSAVTAERDLAVQGGLQIIAERDRLESTLIQTTTRHFAQQWKDRADDKKLDECLSEGIAMLEAERDRLRDAAEKAIAWLDAEQNGSGVGINRRLKLCRDAENSLRAAMAAKEA